MELKQSHPKIFSKSNKLLPLESNKEEIHVINGYFNEFSVIIRDDNDMRKILLHESIGKANNSRNLPTFNQNNSEIIRNRIFQNRKSWNQSNSKKKSEIIVVPDSDSENEDYFDNFVPQYHIDQSDFKENIHLNLEEAFFLNSLNYLNIFNEKNELMNVRDCWFSFQLANEYFVTNYIAFYYYRLKNWIVKPGIKFGGDFLLYKQGPQFHHASYLVIIDILDVNLKRIDKYKRRSLGALEITSLNRLCETSGKDLIICQIIWPNDVNIVYEELNKFTIKEVLVRRFLPNITKLK